MRLFCHIFFIFINLQYLILYLSRLRKRVAQGLKAQELIKVYVVKKQQNRHYPGSLK